nr:reverse transcriptase domain, reverse transcriptase zinc-binding domain protein [Tanacetum cinerariifolium]
MTGSSTLTQTGMVDFVPGQAVIDVAQRKREADMVTLLKRIRKFSMSQDIKARAAARIFNRISFAIAKDITIEDRPLKHVTPAMEDSFKKHVDSLLEIGAIRPSKSRHITMAMIVNSGTTIDHWRDVNGQMKVFLLKMHGRRSDLENSVRHLAGMDHIQPKLNDVVLFLKPMANKRTTNSIIGRLILAATSYFIWLERNNRISKKAKKNPEEIKDIIMVMVRLKLLTFKNTSKVNQLLSNWKMPTLFRLYG